VHRCRQTDVRSTAALCSYVYSQSSMELRYFLYTRRSTDDEKQALSIESQKEELERRFGDLRIVEVIEENGSAFQPNNRPKFEKMLQSIESGKADGIVTWHPDRLSRNVIDGAHILHALDRGVLKDLKFGSYHFHNSPEGKMMLGFALSQSKYFSEKLGVDVMRGMEKKCRMGHAPIKARIGYRNVRTEDRGRRYIEADPTRFDTVRRMWDLMLTGAYTVTDIWRKARDEWGLTMAASRKLPERPISLPMVYDMFEYGIFYAGHFEWGGQRYKGSHPPMITFEEFERTQEILGRSKHRTTKHAFPFTGCIRCGECGSMITAELKQKHLKKTGGIANYIYYSCVGKKGPCTLRGHVREENLTVLLRPYVEAITVSPRVTEWVRDKLSRMTEEDQKLHKVQRENIRRKYENCMKAMQNLVSLYVSAENGDKSLLSDDELKKQKDSLAVERDRYKALLEENERNADSALDQTIRVFDFAQNALKHFDSPDADMNTKREILTTIGTNWKLLRGLVKREANLPYYRIEEGTNAHREHLARLEPKELALVESKSTLSEGEIKIWWPRPGSNR
jgi:site-specific DNA recombinase